MNKLINLFFALLFIIPVVGQAQITTDRQDGRFQSSRGTVQYMLKRMKPTYAFDPLFTPVEFKEWQSGLRAAMKELMRFPEIADLPAPVRIKTVRRDGYRVEKWESYPLPGSVVPYLVLIPDGVDPGHKAPAVLCIPGFGGSKEGLAGENEGDYDLISFPAESVKKNAMALHYVKRGLVAVAVDNPSCAELSDNGHFDYLNTSRILLEMGWSYLGLSAYQDWNILSWMKELDFVNKDRLIVSGFSLGTEPLMVLGTLDPSIYAFVYNDFLCRTLERILVMTKPDPKGIRPFPNSIEHLIPGFLTQFDFPDLVAALAPRPVICTEGGLDRDFDLIRKAYEISGKPDYFTYYHYKKFADPKDRKQIEKVPEGIDRDTYFNLVNVDPENHYFKEEWVLPWIDKILK
ncbi:alpha/beta hydrolase family protein [Parabacteroides sp. W1-Q-101]|uniref:alpha/beta hydrolase family protein n=1 Tax=Parabacteroides TaxID=375288 RepID=UPI00202EBFD4|nr:MULTISPECIES: alpha/beta hydrolase family protein [Parabacteroides]MCM0722138.1 alpha/beta hydrolase family protein [Parabacteroides sp. W1-Q-101]